MKLNDKVTIIPSIELEKAKLEDLIGRTGTIVELCYRKNGSIHGAWVELDGQPYQGEQEWFIPVDSFIL